MEKDVQEEKKFAWTKPHIIAAVAFAILIFSIIKLHLYILNKK